MNWLTNFVRPKVRESSKGSTLDSLWERCNACERMIFQKDLQQLLYVCGYCQHHMPLALRARVEALFDSGSVTELKDISAVPQDPLGFRDLKKYSARFKEAKAKETEAALVFCGTVEGRPMVLFGMTFEFIGGSMGLYVGEAFLHAARAAVRLGCPLVALTSSGGARMQEGIFALMQMPRTVLATTLIKEAGLPYWVLMTHPTTGGVSASFASLGDLILAEPGAVIGFTGRRVIEETIRTTLPNDFQTSAFQKKHGFVDAVVPRSALRATFSQLLRLFSCKPAENVL